MDVGKFTFAENTMDILQFLKTSYTAYHAVENAKKMLEEAGFRPLLETQPWSLEAGGAYYTVRGDASIIAFRYRGGPLKIVASHTDSPCLKLKANAPLAEGDFTRLNTEPYGGGLWYTFFDRPLRIAGRAAVKRGERVVAETVVSPFRVILPSLAIHMDRTANEKFAPDLQTELPLLSLGKAEAEALVPAGTLAYDLFAVCDEEPFFSGEHGEFLSAPRLDDLTGVYASLSALIEENADMGTTVAACLDAEEIGSRTYGGAGGDFLRAVFTRIAGASEEERLRTYASSFLISFDNAHSLHPNHPEKCDPTNRAVMGKGAVIKGHAGGAYTSDAVSIAVIKDILERANVPCQTFYNRSNMRSGSTLGSISTGQVSIRAVDIGIAQLAMHSAVETVAMSDIEASKSALRAFYRAALDFSDGIRIS